MGGGGSSGGTTQQSNQYQSLSPWAQPYITSMLGAAQSQVFNTDQSGNITGINPYNAYGSYNPQTGGQYGLTPSDQMAAQSSVAGFSPLQQQSFQGAANLQTPGQFGQATNYANQGIGGALGSTNQAAMYGGMGAMQGMGTAQQAGNQAGMYGGMGAMSGMQGAQTAGQAAGYGNMGAQAGASYGQNAQNAQTVGSYMNPYLQASLAPQLQLLAQQTGINSAAQQAAATGAGAFGGSRSALANSLTQQAGNLSLIHI